jgi:hypothetical protein
MPLFSDFNKYKKCFVYCGEQCNCSLRQSSSGIDVDSAFQKYKMEKLVIDSAKSALAEEGVVMPDSIDSAENFADWVLSSKH